MLLAAAMVLVFAFAGVPRAEAVVAGGQGRLYLQPNAQKLKTGTQFSVDIYLDTKGAPVNAVEVKLTYPKTRLACVSQKADPTWDISFYPAPCANGVADIVVGQFSNVTGVVRVGTLTFTAGPVLGKALIKFDPKSGAINPNTQMDIVGVAKGGTYTVVASQL